MRPQTHDLGSLLPVAIRVLLVLLALATLVQVAGLGAEKGGLSWFLFVRQDISALALILIIFILHQRPRPTAGAAQPWLARHGAVPTPALLWVGVALLVLLCWGGHYLVFQGYDLSRDEQMANFDAWIFSHGRLMWELPTHWRGPGAEALNQLFILPIGDHEAWVSNYLPGNAALRALVGMVADPALTSPLLSGTAAIALWRIARRLWPDERNNAIVALILLVTSSQFLFTAMTAYAMSAHLALNLVWLALFLADRPKYHAMAIGLGFIATGLHQPVFHPLFVAPFLLLLLHHKRWPLLGAYCAGYAMIGLFWLAWPIWLSAQGLHHIVTDTGDGIGFWDRILRIIALPDIGACWLMALNLLRLLSWQHALFLPLLIAGLLRVWRERDDLARALAIGLVLPLPILFLLLPYQGHGWGYRYLHGVLGNAVLLCVFGWDRLKHDPALRRAMAAATMATGLVLIPLHGWHAWRMTEPYARIDRAIRASPADWAIIDDEAAPFAQDLVLNTPDLSRRPARLMQSKLADAPMTHLCALGETALVVDAAALMPVRRYFGIASPEPSTDPGITPVDIRLKQAGCRVIWLASAFSE
ncbi:MAG: hypothetical protein KA533_06590 [Sphingobium sp.]|nr:hypothetical protein [Sphingobium sp.]MBP6111895.1 hypothetical protein [Sphingobium sp.]MBP8670336.1 hypothetical protein [Sphingobium sp.]MBP9157702.1 hypothetical protein [Sphingobium sp.]